MSNWRLARLPEADSSFPKVSRSRESGLAFSPFDETAESSSRSSGRLLAVSPESFSVNILSVFLIRRYCPKKLPVSSKERINRRISRTITGTSNPVEIQNKMSDMYFISSILFYVDLFCLDLEHVLFLF